MGGVSTVNDDSSPAFLKVPVFRAVCLNLPRLAIARDSAMGKGKGKGTSLIPARRIGEEPGEEKRPQTQNTDKDGASEVKDEFQRSLMRRKQQRCQGDLFTVSSRPVNST